MSAQPRKSPITTNGKAEPAEPVKFRTDSEFANSSKEERLGVLAAKANDCHRKYQLGIIQNYLPIAKAAGEALIEAKKLVKHGNWLKWLDENFQGSVDTAANYMAIASN